MNILNTLLCHVQCLTVQAPLYSFCHKTIEYLPNMLDPFFDGDYFCLHFIQTILYCIEPTAKVFGYGDTVSMRSILKGKAYKRDNTYLYS